MRMLARFAECSGTLTLSDDGDVYQVADRSAVPVEPPSCASCDSPVNPAAGSSIQLAPRVQTPRLRQPPGRATPSTVGPSPPPRMRQGLHREREGSVPLAHSRSTP